MPATEQQRKNYAFFQQKLPELLSDPLKAGKFVIIYDETVEGIYDSFESAYRVACSKISAGFIVQQIVDERKIVNFLSPAVAL